MSGKGWGTKKARGGTRAFPFADLTGLLSRLGSYPLPPAPSPYLLLCRATNSRTALLSGSSGSITPVMMV